MRLDRRRGQIDHLDQSAMQGTQHDNRPETGPELVDHIVGRLAVPDGYIKNLELRLGSCYFFSFCVRSNH